MPTFYTTISMICCFFGGWIIDRVSPRKPLTISFISMGLVGLLFSTFPSYDIMGLILAAFGVATVLTYWLTLIRAVRCPGDSNEQGCLFGIPKDGRGVVSTTVVFALLELFSSPGDGKFGLSWMIRPYALPAVIVGIAPWFLTKDKREDAISGTSLVQQTKSVLLMPRMWAIYLIIFTAYSIYAVPSFLLSYMISIYGTSRNFSVQIGGICYVIQFAGGIIGGFLADKIGSRIETALLGYMVITTFLIVFLLTSQRPSLTMLCVLDPTLLNMTMYAVRGICFVVIDEAQIDHFVTGVVSGMISCIGCLPDVLLYIMIGRQIDQGVQGYRSVFLCSIGTCIVGAAVTAIPTKSIRKIPAKG